MRILLGITIAAALLRFLLLDKESFWIDECFAWYCSRNLDLAFHQDPNNPPLYFSLLHFWSGWFGVSEKAMRSLSALMSVGSVVMSYFIGRQLYSQRVGWITAALMTVSTFQIYFAQEIRNYATQGFFVLLATWFLLRGLGQPDSRRAWRDFVGYGLALAVSLYLHVLVGLMLAAQGVVILLHRPFEWRRFLGAAGAAVGGFLLFAPWLASVLSKSVAASGVTLIHFWLRIPQTFFTFLYGYSMIPIDDRSGKNPRAALMEYGVELGLAALAAVLVAWFVLVAWRRRPGPTRTTAILAFGPAVLCLLVSMKSPIFDERYLYSSGTFILLLVAVGLEEMWERAGLARLAAALYVGLLCWSLSNYYFAPRFGKEQWRQAFEVITARTQPGDLVIFDMEYGRLCWSYYVKQGTEIWGLASADRERIVSRESRAAARIDGHRRIWLLLSHNPDFQVRDSLLSTWGMRETLSRKFPKAKGIELSLLER